MHDAHFIAEESEKLHDYGGIITATVNVQGYRTPHNFN